MTYTAPIATIERPEAPPVAVSTPADVAPATDRAGQVEQHGID